MEIIFSSAALKDVQYWKKTNNKTIQNRITILIAAIILDHFKGIGKPEPLKYQFAGKWSRRIDKANQFVYSVENNTLYIYSLKGHYE